MSFLTLTCQGNNGTSSHHESAPKDKHFTSHKLFCKFNIFNCLLNIYRKIDKKLEKIMILLRMHHGFYFIGYNNRLYFTLRFFPDSAQA